MKTKVIVQIKFYKFIKDLPQVFLAGHQTVQMSCEFEIEEDSGEDEVINEDLPDEDEPEEPTKPSKHLLDDKCLLKNTDFPGPTFKKYEAGDAAKCREMCAGKDECNAFSFLAGQKHGCFLKDAGHGAATVTSPRAKNGAVAGKYYVS